MSLSADSADLIRLRSRHVHLPTTVRPNVPLLVGLLLLPFWVDSAAMLIYLSTGSAALYSLAIQGIDVVALLGLFMGARRGVGLLLKTYGWWIAAPAGLYGIALASSLASASGNHEFILAALRYTVWITFIAAALSRSHGYPPQSTTATGEIDHLNSALSFITIVIAALSVFQLLFSSVLAPLLQSIHEGLTPAEKTNAVLTSLSLGKNFASLTLRNPIELSYVGLALMCVALTRHTNSYMVAAALVIIICGRSNTTILAALAVGLVHSLKGRSWLRRFRWPMAFGLASIAGLFLWFLPEIYLGEGNNWDDFIVVLTYQRLGMLLALPELLSEGGSRLLIGGMPTPLIDLVESLYAAGLLPELFADGGAIAVFDIMWFGFLLVGGLPFVLGGAALIGIGLRQSGRNSNHYTPDAAALQLMCIGILVVSFSSQILLSRYGLYFLCYFLAAKAVSQSRVTPTNSSE